MLLQILFSFIIGSKPGSIRSHPLSASPSAGSDVEVSSNRVIRDRRANAVPIPASPGAGPHLEISFDGMPASSEHDAQEKSAPNLMALQTAGIMAGEEGITALTSPVANPPEEKEKADDASAVSSLTGAGFDQEIVEELHQALTDLRAELEGSRAEAARAVKVAEQAIQSAENSSSKDWNSTVTHKAAEAAALAQKKSAEAMAKQRLAEERLAAERKTAAFWRKQAEAAEEEAGVLQTRAAAAEVQRAAMAEELESERRKAHSLVTTMKKRFTTSESRQQESLESALERNRSLLIELDSTRRELELKSREANTMEEAHPSADGKGSGKGGRKMFMGRKKKQVPDEIDPSAKGLLTSSESGALSQTSSDGHEALVMDQELLEEILRLHVETGIVRKSQLFQVLLFEKSSKAKALSLFHAQVTNTSYFGEPLPMSFVHCRHRLNSGLSRSPRPCRPIKLSCLSSERNSLSKVPPGGGYCTKYKIFAALFVCTVDRGLSHLWTEIRHQHPFPRAILQPNQFCRCLLKKRCCCTVIDCRTVKMPHQ